MREAIDGLVHETARAEPTLRARHLVFLGVHLAIGIAALAAFPILFAFGGPLSRGLSVVLAGLVSALPIAVYLARTGHLDTAHKLSAGAGCALVAIAAPGLDSGTVTILFFSVLFAVTSGKRQTVEAALGASLLAIMVLIARTTLAGSLTPGLALTALGYFGGLGLAAITAIALLGLNRLEGRRAAEGEARYLLLAENMNDVVLRHGGGGRVEFASPTARITLGSAPEGLLGQGFFDRINVADRPAYLATLTAAERDGATGLIELRVRSGDSVPPVTLWVELRCRSVGEGEARAVVSVVRDISARKAHDIEVERARAAAEAANASKGRFLATVSHELRTPLNAIIGFSEMLVHEDMIRLDPARRVEYAKLINESGLHLLSVVNGILDMSKLDSGTFELTPEPFDLAETVRGSIAMLKLKIAESGIDLVTALDDTMGEIVADKRACRQILLNLLSNALKFTPAGGRVTVSASRERGGVVISVTDTGCGIAPADVARLGEPFFQAKTSYDRPVEGTGLGLSIVKGLAALHGGRLDVASRVGEGTTMSVVLPTDCENPAARAALEPAPTNIARLVVASRDATTTDREKQRA